MPTINFTSLERHLPFDVQKFQPVFDFLAHEFIIALVFIGDRCAGIEPVETTIGRRFRHERRRRRQSSRCHCRLSFSLSFDVVKFLYLWSWMRAPSPEDLPQEEEEEEEGYC